MILLLLAACQFPTSAPPQTPLPSGSIKVEALGTYLRGPRNAPRVVNFWASWCGPCVAEMPRLRAFSQAHPEVELVFVNLDHPNRWNREGEKLLQRFEISEFPNLALNENDSGMALLSEIPNWPPSIPVTLFIAPDGTEASRLARAASAQDLEIGLRSITNAVSD